MANFEFRIRADDTTSVHVAETLGRGASRLCDALEYSTDVNALAVPEIRDWRRTEQADRAFVSYLVRDPGQRYWSYVELDVDLASDTVEPVSA